jgi:hypothetical protein
MSVLGRWLGYSVGNWFGQVQANQPANVIQPSGGWHWFRWDRRRKHEDDDELEEALEAHLLAEHVIEPVTPVQKVRAYMAVTDPETVPKHVRDAIKRAVRSETAAAFQLALKRIREMEEEDEFAVLFLTLH